MEIIGKKEEMALLSFLNIEKLRNFVWLLEVIANHPVLPTILVQQHTGNGSQISWFVHATDLSDGELKEEVFCVRFVYMEGFWAFAKPGGL
ncbi:ran-binding protein 1 homolog c-like [Papaver somniferum]|uniref:ran-binding protein 1 homolog c-like n=1 Tax=Papaver somniferum TaxID=3469 RepID=UPI000E6F884B|nr:ran-binding protein 1 homolog c-like [Papaver somniferum]